MTNVAYRFLGIGLAWLTLSGCNEAPPVVKWEKIPDVAQYKGADWHNEVRRENGISLQTAMAIGATDVNITYFFYTKGERMVLEGQAGADGYTAKGIFYHGDTVFFSGQPWYGSAQGLADAYEKHAYQ